MGDLIQEISKLSVNDRIRLVQAILQTIAVEQEPTESFDLSDVQKKEIEKRSTDVKEGLVKSVSWEEIQLKLAQRYGV
jgi:putative addiction module component (TIGR02574 family)